MSTVTVEVKGLSELQATLSKLPGKLQERTGVKAVSAAAAVIQAEVKARAPVRSHPGGKKISKGKGNAGLRYPGNLKKHIGRRRTSRGSGTVISYAVGPTGLGWYGKLVEMGTRVAAAHPFMRPAIAAKGDQAVEQFRLTLGAGIDDAVRASK
jgi:HK97 gp10 family phage protein